MYLIYTIFRISWQSLWNVPYWSSLFFEMMKLLQWRMLFLQSEFLENTDKIKWFIKQRAWEFLEQEADTKCKPPNGRGNFQALSRHQPHNGNVEAFTTAVFFSFIHVNTSLHQCKLLTARYSLILYFLYTLIYTQTFNILYLG